MVSIFVLIYHAFPVWTQAVAGYRLEKWENPWNEIETVYLKDWKGRVVTTVQDYRVTPLFDGEFGDVPVKVENLTSNGVPDIILEGWSGGAHGSNTYYAWELGKHPHCLIAYAKGNVNGHDEGFNVVHKAQGSAGQIRSWYDGFAYIACSPMNDLLPVIFRYEHGRLVDRTTRYPTVLEAATREAWQWLFLTDYQRSTEGVREGPASPAVMLIALADMKHTRSGAWKALKEVLHPETYAWLLKREPDILKIIRGRTKRYAYPKAYDPRPIRINPYPPDGTFYDFGW